MICTFFSGAVYLFVPLRLQYTGNSGLLRNGLPMLGFIILFLFKATLLLKLTTLKYFLAFRNRLCLLHVQFITEKYLTL